MLDQTFFKDLVSISWAHLNRVEINFDRLTLQLKEIYEAELKSPDSANETHDRRFLPEGRAVHTLQRQDVKEIVKELFDLSEKYHKRKGWSAWRKQRRRWSKRRDAATVTSSETWYERVCGNDVEDSEPEDGRAKLLAILALSEVKLTSRAWTSFVQQCLRSPNPNEKRFCDRLLPFPETTDIVQWFGRGPHCHGLICKILVNQRIVCPYIINGNEENVPPEARMPYYKERSMKVNKDGDGLWKVEVDTKSCRGSVPSGWIARKDVRKDKTAEAEESSNRRLAGLEIQRHAHILEFYGVAKSRQKTSFFMELADCSLYEHMEADVWPGCNADRKIDFFEAALGPGRALVFLHDHGIHHRDIKSDNILLARDREGRKRPFHWKISDFGLSSIANSNGHEVVRHVDQLHHCPPEFLQKLSPAPSFSSSGDVWSYGCLCLEILAWLIGGRGGGEDFCTSRMNSSYTELEITVNYWYFTVDRDPTRSEEDCDSAANASCNSRDYYTCKKTQNGKKPIVIKNNQAVIDYFRKACRLEDHGEQRKVEKKFALQAFKIILQLALVPNPSRRASMSDLCNQLEALIKEYRR